MTGAGPLTGVGIVLIGRNEGARLRGCLESVRGRATASVYVDSGSTDGSVALAKSFGADVVELPMDRPFTAARSRNAGFGRLLALFPDLELVQFVDGDCRVAEGWLETSAASLRDRNDLAVVCGRRREAFPGSSVYNRLCDLEWDTPVGEAMACGGDAMMKVAAFKAVGGFNPDVIAGEEPELCLRLRAAGWKIQRLDAEMTLHDAAMTRFSQWWRRNVRTGYGTADASARHGQTHERQDVRAVRSMILWAGALPFLALLAAWPSRGLSIPVLLLVYLAQGGRMYLRERGKGRVPRDARAYAFFTLLGKAPQIQGVVRFWIHRARGQQARIIEYKTASPTVPARSTQMP